MGFVCHGGPPSLIACVECKGGQEQRRVGGTALLMYCYGNGTTTIPLHVLLVCRWDFMALPGNSHCADCGAASMPTLVLEPTGLLCIG